MSVRDINLIKCVFGVILLATASTILSYAVMKHIAETVFFDKFIYYKSPEFGYWPNEDITLWSFGRRGKDLAELDSFANNIQYSVPGNVLGVSSKHDARITIVVIGDSYVWGQGIRDENRFPSVLETKLNKLAPTRVVSLGRQGDGLFDHYAKYELARYAYPDAKLYIFGIVDNDITQLAPNSYNETYLQSLISECGKPFLYVTEGYPEDMYFSDSYANVCIMQQTIARLPRRNALYFDYGSEYFGQFSDKGKNVQVFIQEAGLPFLSSSKEIGEIAGTDERKLYVSGIDSHPSVLANRVFADALYRYIVSSTRLYQTQK